VTNKLKKKQIAVVFYEFVSCCLSAIMIISCAPSLNDAMKKIPPERTKWFNDEMLKLNQELSLYKTITAQKVDAGEISAEEGQYNIIQKEKEFENNKIRLRYLYVYPYLPPDMRRELGAELYKKMNIP